MTDEFFTEADCDVIERASFDGIHHVSKGISPKKANQVLRERGKVVYGSVKEGIPNYWGPRETCTHTALLINVQPVEQDSAESLLREVTDWLANEKYNAPVAAFVSRARKLLEKWG